MSPQPKRSPRQITEAELSVGFNKLTNDEWRYADARPFTKRVRASVSVAAPFLIEQLRTGNKRERERAAELLGQLEGPRVLAPLWDIFRDEQIEASVRAAAGALLETMDEPSAIKGVQAGIDYEPIIHDALEAIFRRAQQEEGFRERFLHELEADEPEERKIVLSVLAEAHDERALDLILPLLYSTRVRTIMLAIETLETLGSSSPIDRLQEVATGDPSPEVRQRAREAFGRLIMQSSVVRHNQFSVRTSATSTLPVVHASVSLLDQKGDQAITVGRRRADGYLKVVTVLCNQENGVKSCTGVEKMTAEELADIITTLESQGLTPVDVEPPFAGILIEEARLRSIEKRRRLPAELAIWREAIVTAPRTTCLPLQNSTDEIEASIEDTGALLATPEFRQWFFEPDLVWPYVNEWQSGTLLQRSSSTGGRTLEALISLAARDLVDDEFAGLLRRRLERQADLLKLSNKNDLYQLTRASLTGLDPSEGCSPEDHPFIRAMILSSFFNAGLRLSKAHSAELS